MLLPSNSTPSMGQLGVQGFVIKEIVLQDYSAYYCYSICCCLLQAQSPSARAHSGQSKLGNRHDSGSNSMDIEDAPPTSDADVCISTTSSSARMASAAVSAGKLSFRSFHTLLFPFACGP